MPSATRCSVRRSTTTCCPASARGSTPTSSPRWARAVRSAPPPSSPSTPAAPTTGRSPSVPRSRPGEEALAVGGPSEAATHFLDALELIDTSRTPVTDVDALALVRRCAEALVAAGRVPKAVKVLRARLATMPARRRRQRPRPAPDDPGLGPPPHRHHRVAPPDRRRGRRPAARRIAQAARAGALRPRRDPRQLARRGGPHRGPRGARPGRAQRPHQPRGRDPHDPGRPRSGGWRRPRCRLARRRRPRPQRRPHRARAPRALLPRPAPPRPRRPRRRRRGLPRGHRAQRDRRAHLVALPGRVATAPRRRADAPGPPRRGVEPARRHGPGPADGLRVALLRPPDADHHRHPRRLPRQGARAAPRLLGQRRPHCDHRRQRGADARGDGRRPGGRARGLRRHRRQRRTPVARVVPGPAAARHPRRRRPMRAPPPTSPPTSARSPAPASTGWCPTAAR